MSLKSGDRSVMVKPIDNFSNTSINLILSKVKEYSILPNIDDEI